MFTLCIHTIGAVCDGVETNRERIMKMIQHAFAQFLIWTLCGAACAQSAKPKLEAEPAVRRNVHRFYSYFSQQRYEKMWDMISAEMKKDNNRSDYVKELKRMRSLRARVGIKRVEIIGDKATVTIILSLRTVKVERWLDEIHQDTWVRENGKWLFDRSITLEEIPPPVP